MAKEPSQFEMKKQFNLPENAVFLGWVIHHPENDEYVVTYTSNEYMANIGWGLSPEKAKKFKTLKKANSVISDGVSGAMEPKTNVRKISAHFIE